MNAGDTKNETGEAVGRVYPAERSGLLASPLGLFGLGLTAINLLAMGGSYYSGVLDPERAHTILHLVILAPVVVFVAVFSGFVMGLAYFAPKINPGAAGRVLALGVGNLLVALAQVPLYFILR
jgi:hypothetical protein